MSGNINQNARSMNGIISLFSEDIKVNNLDANNINVQNLDILNALVVNTTTITPSELQQLENLNTNETIQQQFNNINTELDNVVDLTSNQTISGNKNFSSILELTGDLLVSNSNFIPENTTISKEQLSTLKDINTTKTIQEQINNVSIDGFMDLTTIQVSQAFKIFSNGLQTPSITNQEGTGIVNGYFINSTQVLYTSYSGTFTLNVSKLTGIDSNETISVFDTVNKLITIDTATTTSLPIKNIESYKPNDATTEIFIYYTIAPNLQQNQGVIFNEISDFIDVINTYSYFPLNSISVNSSFIKSFQGYINNGKLITPTTIAYNNFIEGTGTNRPTIIREDNPQLTNIYLIASPNSFTNEPIKSTPSGFIKNGNFWLSTSYTLSDNNFVEGSSTTIQEGTEIINSNVDSYQYTTTVNDSVSYYTGEGIVVGVSPQLRIFDTSQIILGSGLFNTTDNDEYGFVSSIQSGYKIFTSKSNLISDSFTTLNAYINSNNNLVCLTNNTNKFSSTDGITKIIEQIGTTHTYVIQSPLLINPDTFSSTLGYKYDANTLITDTIINNDFFFEIPSVVNQYGSFVSTFNDFLLPCINSDYVSPTKSGTYKACVVAMGSKDYIFFGAYDVAGTNDFVVNEQLAPYTSVCEIELGYTPPRTYNGKEINGLRVAPITSSSITNNVDYCIHNGQYFFETTLLSINDVVVKNTSNTFINGRYIQSQTGNGYKLSTLTGGYTEGFQIPRAGNKTWSKNKALNIFSAKSQYAGGTNPQIGNFLICNDPNFIVSKITNVISNGTNWEIEIGPNVNFSSFVSGSDLFLYTTYGTITNGFYSPVDFDVYEGLNINRFIQTQSFYENKSYDFYNQETNDIYENRTYDEFLNSNSDIYNNNQYIIDTTVLLDLPNTGINDTIVVENFSQNLSQKTFTDDTTFQQDIDVVDVRASGNIDCVDLTATGNITGSGILDMTNNAVIHKLGDISIGDTTTDGVNNPALAHSNFEGTTGFNVLLQNTGKLILNAPAGQEVSIRNNNAEKVKITGSNFEITPGSFRRFYVADTLTRLFERESGTQGVDVFQQNNNSYIDFFDDSKNYDVRMRVVHGSSTGNGSLYNYCFRMYLRNGTSSTNQIDMGVLDGNSSFLRGRGTSTWINFHRNNEIYWYLNGSTKMTMATNGYHYAVLHVNTSDIRLKSNIVDVSNALQTINTIEVKEFDKKCSMCCDDDDCTEELSHEIGFIAQQIEETDLSFCVSSSQLNDTKGLKDSCIFALNVKATQELYEMVMKQQGEIEELKNIINELIKNNI